MNKNLLLALVALLAGSMPALGAPLIINEFNAVGEGKLLPGGDTLFGSVPGNGGNWVELVVTQDHLDIRGWKLEWSNADPDAGNVVFTNDALWLDLRSGTIITLREDDTGDPGPPVGARPTDVSFNPGGNDFWLEINVDDALYMIKNGFKVDNDDWAGTLRNSVNGLVQGPIGEAAGAPWSGGGINSTEAGALGINPTASPIGAGYRDVTFSSYGAANWLNAAGTLKQDFTALRAWVPEPSSVVLAVLGTCGALAMAWRRRGASLTRRL